MRRYGLFSSIVPLFALAPFVLAARVAGSAETKIGVPLVVDETSHVVVMEYEAWFGPNAVTFQGAAAMPILQSADMIPVGGG